MSTRSGRPCAVGSPSSLRFPSAAPKKPLLLRLAAISASSTCLLTVTHSWLTLSKNGRPLVKSPNASRTWGAPSGSIQAHDKADLVLSVTLPDGGADEEDDDVQTED